VEIPIIEEDSYEKDVLFYLELGEPTSLGGKVPLGAPFDLALVLLN